jgi:hypothetical protein
MRYKNRHFRIWDTLEPPDAELQYGTLTTVVDEMLELEVVVAITYYMPQFESGIDRVHHSFVVPSEFLDWRSYSDVMEDIISDAFLTVQNGTKHECCELEIHDDEHSASFTFSKREQPSNTMLMNTGFRVDLYEGWRPDEAMHVFYELMNRSSIKGKKAS